MDYVHSVKIQTPKWLFLPKEAEYMAPVMEGENAVFSESTESIRQEYITNILQKVLVGSRLLYKLMKNCKDKNFTERALDLSLSIVIDNYLGHTEHCDCNNTRNLTELFMWKHGSNID